MADYPCDKHLARYQGPSTRLYMNVFREEEEFHLRYSVCGDCLVEIMDLWLGQALRQTPAGYWDPLEPGTSLDELWEASERREKGLRRSKVYR